MSNIINCIKENVYNSKVIVINNILGLIVNDKEIKDGVYRERLDNIDAREGLFLMIPRLLLSVLKSPRQWY